jgi:hypothetical protein
MIPGELRSGDQGDREHRRSRKDEALSPPLAPQEQ